MAFGAILAWLFPQIAKSSDEEELVYKVYLNARNVLLSISVVLLGIFCLLKSTYSSIIISLAISHPTNDKILSKNTI